MEAMEMQNWASSALPVKDRDTTQTLFVDGVHGMTVFETTVLLNLTRTTTTSPGSGLEPAYIDTVVRLAIPLQAFSRIAEFMKNNLDELIRQGVFANAKQPENGE